MTSYNLTATLEAINELLNMQRNYLHESKLIHLHPLNKEKLINDLEAKLNIRMQ